MKFIAIRTFPEFRYCLLILEEFHFTGDLIIDGIVAEILFRLRIKVYALDVLYQITISNPEFFDLCNKILFLGLLAIVLYEK